MDNKPTGKEIVKQILPYIDEKINADKLKALYNCIDSAIEMWATHYSSLPQYDYHDGGKVNCHPQYIDGFNAGAKSGIKNSFKDFIEGIKIIRSATHTTKDYNCFTICIEKAEEYLLKTEKDEN